MTKPSKAELLEMADRLYEARARADGTIPSYVQTAMDGAALLRRVAEEPECTLKPARLLDGRNVTVRARADEAQRLYKPVGTPEIIAAIKEEFGAGISSRNVVLPELIHKLGVFNVKLAFDAAFAIIKVWVVQDESEPEETKIETFQVTAARLREGPSRFLENVADLCAIVLRRHLALLRLIQREFKMRGSPGHDAVQQEIVKVEQMLMGSGE